MTGYHHWPPVNLPRSTRCHVQASGYRNLGPQATPQYIQNPAAYYLRWRLSHGSTGCAAIPDHAALLLPAAPASTSLASPCCRLSWPAASSQAPHLGHALAMLPCSIPMTAAAVQPLCTMSSGESSMALASQRGTPRRHGHAYTCAANTAAAHTMPAASTGAGQRPASLSELV